METEAWGESVKGPRSPGPPVTERHGEGSEQPQGQAGHMVGSPVWQSDMQGRACLLGYSYAFASILILLGA